MSCSINDELRKEWVRLLQGTGTVQEKDIERCELAALQLRDRLVSIPYYAERDRQGGMHYWRGMHASDYPVG